MDWLEHRIPPPLVAISFAALIWLFAGPVRLQFSWYSVAVLLVALAGLVVCLAGVVSFRLARTTVNPLKPETASSLVRSGVYRYTRNPMYLGFAMLLLAWGLLFSLPLALLGVTGFVLFINRFQIAPEERVLAELFGSEFSAYRQQTRRWL